MKRHIADRMELPKQEKLERTEKRILESGIIKHVEMKEKI